MEALSNYLGDINTLTQTSSGEKDYVHPKLKNLGSVSIVTVREIIAPTVFRNQENEVTDTELLVSKDGHQETVRAIRAVPNKFKHKERGRGLQILRHFGVGGRSPQNRQSMGKDETLDKAFDINSLVFGDSVNANGPSKSPYPVKAAVLYSDGISLSEYDFSVGKTFHNRAFEDGSLFDPYKKTISNNLFDRHYVKPGTLLVQVVSTHGRLLPKECLDHLLLSMSSSGAYGGQTSVTGVNVRTHIAGIYASKVEKASTSPFLIASHILAQDALDGVEDAIRRIDDFVARDHELRISSDEVMAYRDALISRLEDENGDLQKQYQTSAEKVGAMFQSWFSGKAA